MYEKHRLRDITEVAHICRSCPQRKSRHRDISPQFSARHRKRKPKSQFSLYFDCHVQWEPGAPVGPMCSLKRPAGSERRPRRGGGGWRGPQTEASGGRGGSRGRASRGAECPAGLLRSRGGSSNPGRRQRPARETALAVRRPGSCAGRVLTAGTAGHSCLPSSSPDASLSGRCSPQALRFCPTRSAALFGVSAFQP